MQEIQLPLATLLVQIPDGSALKSSEAGTTQADGSANGTTPAKEAQPGMFGNPVFMLVIMGAFFWFVLIGPERKRRKKQAALLAGLSKGDEVITNAGLYGTVVQIQDQVVTLQVAEGVRMKFSLQAVQGLSASADSKP